MVWSSVILDMPRPFSRTRFLVLDPGDDACSSVVLHCAVVEITSKSLKLSLHVYSSSKLVLTNQISVFASLATCMENRDEKTQLIFHFQEVSMVPMLALYAWHLL